MSRNTSNTYLVFSENGKDKLVSIDSILTAGYPIDPETGDDLELLSAALVDEMGVVISK